MYILGIDPGTSTVGVSLLKLDESFNVKERESILIDVTKTGYVNRLNNKTDYKLAIIHNRITDIIRKFKPISMVIEMPFFNPRRPQAVIPLARSLQAIMGAMVISNPNVPIVRPSPSNIKNAVGVKGNSGDKDEMTQAVLKLGLCDGDESEHEIDAIAANYYLLNLLKVNYMLPYLR